MKPDFKRARGWITLGKAGSVSCALLIGFTLVSCSTVKPLLAIESPEDNLRPIENPFMKPESAEAKERSGLVLRSRKGDESVEIEIPSEAEQMSELVLPMHQKPGAQRGPASDKTYAEHKPTPLDREITSRFPQGNKEVTVDRDMVERELGLTASEDSRPQRSTSYLAAVDQIKQLYRAGRFEGALLEIEALLRDYETDPKLYEMKGTILQRLGYTDLALQSWRQALEFNPSNQTLKKFLDRRGGSATLRAPAGGSR